ncbi:MAG: helix-turn-helix domain-containing protein [Candidatus Avispirillum sp.]
MGFGDVLRELLESKNITQKQLAEDLNIGVTTIGNYVRGLREPDFATLKALARYFNVSTDYLLNLHTDKTETHAEDELLHIYRSLTPEQQRIYLEQGKAFRKGKSR